MPRPQTTVCTDCGGAMQEIKLVAKGFRIWIPLIEYAAIDTQPSYWTGAIRPEGTVHSYMCSGCGLIKTYGSPGSNPSDLTSGPTE